MSSSAGEAGQRGSKRSRGCGLLLPGLVRRDFLRQARPAENWITISPFAAAEIPSRFSEPGRPRPQEEESGRAFTTTQMQPFIQALPELEAVHGARARAFAEILMLTGRRPSEILRLTANCLRYRERQRDDGRVERDPFLHYYASKVKRWHSLFIDEETAGVIQMLVDLARFEYEGTPLDELLLFPGRTANSNGRKRTGSAYYSSIFSTWRSFPIVARALQDRERSVPYDFRHTFAQRHADAGVPIDVLQDMMCPVSSDTTRGCYQITAQRRIDAVAVMRNYRFDRNGVRLDVGEQELIDIEYQRAGLTGVAVPLGECSHPSMLKPGDQRCPVRFRCLGCSMFRRR